MSTIKKEISNLSVDDRLLLIETLWDSIDPKLLETEWEFDDHLKKELDARLERLESGTSKTFSWKEMKKRILSRQ